MGSEAAQLYVLVVACQPLAPGEWARIPGALPGLAAALPAVLDRSAEEAGLLVRCLPPAARPPVRLPCATLPCQLPLRGLGTGERSLPAAVGGMRCKAVRVMAGCRRDSCSVGGRAESFRPFL